MGMRRNDSRQQMEFLREGGEHHSKRVYPHTHQVLPKLHSHHHKSQDDDDDEDEEEEEEEEQEQAAARKVSTGARHRKISDSVHTLPTIMDESPVKVEGALDERAEDEKKDAEKDVGDDEAPKMFSIGQAETTDDEGLGQANEGFAAGQIPSALEGAKGVEGFMRSEADRRGVTFTVVGETSHAEDDEHRDHKTDPENRTKKMTKKKKKRTRDEIPAMRRLGSEVLDISGITVGGLGSGDGGMS